MTLSIGVILSESTRAAVLFSLIFSSTLFSIIGSTFTSSTGLITSLIIGFSTFGVSTTFLGEELSKEVSLINVISNKGLIEVTFL